MTERQFADRRPLAVGDIETVVGQLVPGGVVPDDERTRLIIDLSSRDDHDSTLAAKVLLADLLTMGMLGRADPPGSFRRTAREIKDDCGGAIPTDAVCIVTQERTGGARIKAEPFAAEPFAAAEHVLAPELPE